MAWSENGVVDTINNLSSSGGDTLGFTASKLKCLLSCNNIAADRPVTNQTTAEMSFLANAAVLIWVNHQQICHLVMTCNCRASPWASHCNIKNSSGQMYKWCIWRKEKYFSTQNLVFIVKNVHTFMHALHHVWHFIWNHRLFHDIIAFNSGLNSVSITFIAVWINIPLYKLDLIPACAHFFKWSPTQIIHYCGNKNKHKFDPLMYHYSY